MLFGCKAGRFCGFFVVRQLTLKARGESLPTTKWQGGFWTWRAGQLKGEKRSWLAKSSQEPRLELVSQKYLSETALPGDLKENKTTTEVSLMSLLSEAKQWQHERHATSVMLNLKLINVVIHSILISFHIWFHFVYLIADWTHFTPHCLT